MRLVIFCGLIGGAIGLVIGQTAVVGLKTFNTLERRVAALEQLLKERPQSPDVLPEVVSPTKKDR